MHTCLLERGGWTFLGFSFLFFLMTVVFVMMRCYNVDAYHGGLDFTLDLFTTDTYSMAIQTPTTAPVELCFGFTFCFYAQHTRTDTRVMSLMSSQVGF